MRREITVAARTPRCRVPHCDRDSVSRGLCRSCYQGAYVLVNIEKVTTWEDLEKRGKVAATTSTKAWLLS